MTVVDQPADRPAQDASPPLLEVRGLGVRFGGVVALNGVDLTVRRGSLHGLIGPNGAGKTTFIDAITGFERCAAGAVSFAGRRVDRWPPHRRVQIGLSRTFQNLELYAELTVAENLAVPYRVARHRPGTELEQIVEQLRLADVLSRQVRTLPHGRQRIVSIGRALAARPEMLVLDEPAAGLDTDETKELGRTLRTIQAGGITVLLVDHDMGLVMDICDWITVLELGRNLAAGPPRQVAADPQVQRVYLGET